ncbi:sialate O-acetylesterase [Jiulongibacter sp. NS-SX5]|uniref:sialate O-acetylesterase n=1 Tax=Jiulongibacter sp. NS-SX5 TaxID=3463854 RepID=UPI004057D4A8
MRAFILTVFVLFNFLSSSAQLKVANIFGDHMVLQRNEPIKIWGFNNTGEEVSVVFNSKKYTARTNDSGRWQISMDALPAGGPYTLKISDNNESVTLNDLLIGEVWLCSGQSNMEWKVAAVNNAAEEISEANWPTIRHIEVPKSLEFSPQSEIKEAAWEVCSPETVDGFSAVGYFFARELTRELGVPVGLVHSSWGGSHVETWISKSGMLNSEILSEYASQMPNDWVSSNQKMEKQTIAFFHDDPSFDITTLSETDYLKNSYDFAGWKEIDPMYQWDWKGVPSFRGTVYIQKEIELDKAQTSGTSKVFFGECSGDLTFYVNGKMVYHGYTENEISFQIPEGILEQGKNSLLVKFSENRDPEWRAMGLYGNREDFKLVTQNGSVPLMNGDWKARPSWESPRHYKAWMNNEGALCYNAMIAPLVGLSMQGALWYQGESNAGRAFDYRESFPLLIKDWRSKWGKDFPFYWVQLSSYGAFNDSNTGSDWAELREAQSMTLALPKTGEAVTIDIGNPHDIHPRNKQDVGLRLALNALQNTYGMSIVGSGPRFSSVSFKKGKATLTFNSIGSGLEAKDKFGYLKGFEIAGADKKFYFAKAEINGNTVVVSHPEVSKPAAVRYGWSNSPVDSNLYNKQGLPASPFRTDDWKGVTEGEHFK